MKGQTETSQTNNDEYYEHAEFGKTGSSNVQENVSEEHTMIVHKNVPSGDNMINFEEESKQTEESQPSDSVFKRESKISIINDPSLRPEDFRRVELTSSFKRLPKIIENSG